MFSLCGVRSGASSTGVTGRWFWGLTLGAHLSAVSAALLSPPVLIPGPGVRITGGGFQKCSCPGPPSPDPDLTDDLGSGLGVGLVSTLSGGLECAVVAADRSSGCDPQVG